MAKGKEEEKYKHIPKLPYSMIACVDPAAPAGTYNASDDTRMKMGEYFDLVAARLGLPKPPRVSRRDAGRAIPALMLSFMAESRRLVNRKMKEHLGVKLCYPTVYDGVPSKRVAA